MSTIPEQISDDLLNKPRMHHPTNEETHLLSLRPT